MSAAISAQGHAIEIRRMVGLETAVTMLGGQQALGDAIGVSPRTVRAKLSAERGISAIDLRLAAQALDDEAQRLLTHAEKLRGLIA